MEKKRYAYVYNLSLKITRDVADLFKYKFQAAR